MSTPEPQDIKPEVKKSPAKKRKVKAEGDADASVTDSPNKKGKTNRSTAPKGSSSKARQTAPAITPENLDPPLTGARDPRLTVAYIEKLIDDSNADSRRDIAVMFGIKPGDYGQAWADTMKFRVKKVIRSGLLGNPPA